MKKLICMLLALTLALTALTGCDRRSELPEEGSVEDGEVNFAPEATAIGGLTGALDISEKELDYASQSGENAGSGEAPEGEIPGDEASGDESQPVADDEPIDPEEATLGSEFATVEPNSDSPFATPTPQPNAAVSQYEQVSAPGLGFRFSYPAGWVNIPGRSTVCYVQPLEDGTVYPARVAVTMKRMPHTTYASEAQSELANYLRTLMAQYDSSTFRVDTKLNTSTRFMGKRALSTTYLAYDGTQEIKGYAIITYFDRYLFVFHFLCAYEDYESFSAALRYMRDSVQADASVAPD